LFAILALSVLAPLGLTAVSRRLPSRFRAAHPFIALLAVAFVVVEFWNPPVHTTRFTLPPIYEAIAKDNGDFAVLELPVSRVSMTAQQGDIVSAGMQNYSQITHGKATVGGYISRGKDKDVAWLDQAPGFAYLSCPACPDVPRPEDLDSRAVREEFSRMRIKYAVLDLRDFEGTPTRLVTEQTTEAVTGYIEHVLGFEEIDRGESYIAYRNPAIQ